MDKEQEDSNKLRGRIEVAELKKISDFFSLLIQIDRRVSKNKDYGKQDK